MSTFIPKAETFRRAWTDTVVAASGIDPEIAEEMFDTWLSAVKEEAREAGFEAGLSAEANCF
jgi:1,2-phenylacetyl-CoA epoxidase catalytic subunit